MVNELCQLASSGVSIKSIIFIGIILILLGAVSYLMYKSGRLKTKWILPIMLLAFTVLTPLSQPLFAQSVSGCNGQTTDTRVNNTSIGDGNLVNDGPSLTGFFDIYQSYPFPLIAYSALHTIVNNDTAPGGDPFNFSTLRLLGGNSVMDEGQEKFLILDPNDQTLPLNPDDIWNDVIYIQSDSNTNLWGWWQLELTCNVSDLVNCLPPGPLDDHPICSNPGNGTCWPSGKVKVSLKNTIPAGTYTIPYTVDTVGGTPLNTATISIEVPGTPPEPPIIGARDIYIGDCSGWGFFPQDLMSLITYGGSGTLLPSTIDLLPDTPELDKSITVTEPGGEVYTFTVDNDGILTLDNLNNPISGWGINGIFKFTIMDSGGMMSNVGLAYINVGCGG